MIASRVHTRPLASLHAPDVTLESTSLYSVKETPLRANCAVLASIPQLALQIAPLVAVENTLETRARVHA